MRRVTQCGHSLCLPPCCQKDPTVRKANGAGRQKEGKHRRHQSKGQGDLQAALKGHAPRWRQLKVGLWVEFVRNGGVTNAGFWNP